MIIILKEFIWRLEYKIGDIRSYFTNKHLQKLYPDYKEDEYNCGSLKFIWGVKSWDDLTGKDACIYTMNDIDITYDRETKTYSLSIETVYCFKDKNAECKYLKRLLDAFTAYMSANNLSQKYEYMLYMSDTTIRAEADSIEELYVSFKIFVDGFCKVFES